MKKICAIPAGIAAAVLVIATAMLFVRSGTPSATPDAEEAEPGAIGKPPRAEEPPHRSAPLAEPEPVIPIGPERVEPNHIRLKAGNILATINGVAVQGRDLLVFGAASKPEQDLAPEFYDALLKRAINRELIVQAAKTKGVDILPGQEGQLDQVRKSVLARGGGDPNVKYMNVQGTLQEQLEFELRDARAMLLRNTLLAQRGHPLPYVTAEQVKARYNAEPASYGFLPEDPAGREAAWQEIDFQIRSELAPQLQADYQAQVEAFMQELKDSARVVSYEVFEQ
ncbi:MAG: hypothetical protein V1929_12645 [bacterium]